VTRDRREQSLLQHLDRVAERDGGDAPAGGQPELLQEDAEPEEGDAQNDKIRPGPGAGDVPAVENLAVQDSKPTDWSSCFSVRFSSAVSGCIGARGAPPVNPSNSLQYLRAAIGTLADDHLPFIHLSAIRRTGSMVFDTARAPATSPANALFVYSRMVCRLRSAADKDRDWT